jgi:transposase-like protein
MTETWQTAMAVLLARYERGEIARELGVSPTTITNWSRAHKTPQPTHRRALVSLAEATAPEEYRRRREREHERALRAIREGRGGGG